MKTMIVTYEKDEKRAINLEYDIVKAFDFYATLCRKETVKGIFKRRFKKYDKVCFYVVDENGKNIVCTYNKTNDKHTFYKHSMGCKILLRWYYPIEYQEGMIIE